MKDALLPFAYRLKDILSNANEKPHVTITLESDLETQENSSVSDKRYEGLIEMVWPLTNGPWRSTIILSNSLKQQFGGQGLTERILRRCRGNLETEGEPEIQEVCGDVSVWSIKQYWNYKYEDGAGIGFKVRPEKRYKVGFRRAKAYDVRV
ncbi:uncharacterized protein DFL_001728 [Arthrobotrys flagrans]|uniref:Uncharacterized protein n=1 Tax=Arthrobotrys flagrans TaxID=97331 RepID=A0A437A8I2_ARTFL|nr:hypothetical protein DFL_001728 [Arthrobotrys flagrans]